jgi:hypothetical protein
MVDQLLIERRARALVADGMTALAAWNQACQETGALDEPDPLDEVDVVKIIQAIDTSRTVLLMEDLRQAG